jgi:hypothetical protein
VPQPSYYSGGRARHQLPICAPCPQHTLLMEGGQCPLFDSTAELPRIGWRRPNASSASLSPDPNLRANSEWMAADARQAVAELSGTSAAWRPPGKNHGSGGCIVGPCDGCICDPLGRPSITMGAGGGGNQRDLVDGLINSRLVSAGAGHRFQLARGFSVRLCRPRHPGACWHWPSVKPRFATPRPAALVRKGFTSTRAFCLALSSSGSIWPDAIAMPIAGHFRRTISASSRPSMEPGILTSARRTSDKDCGVCLAHVQCPSGFNSLRRPGSCFPTNPVRGVPGRRARQRIIRTVLAFGGRVKIV